MRWIVVFADMIRQWPPPELPQPPSPPQSGHSSDEPSRSALHAGHRPFLMRSSASSISGCDFFQSSSIFCAASRAHSLSTNTPKPPLHEFAGVLRTLASKPALRNPQATSFDLSYEPSSMQTREGSAEGDCIFEGFPTVSGLTSSASHPLPSLLWAKNSAPHSGQTFTCSSIRISPIMVL